MSATDLQQEVASNSSETQDEASRVISNYIQTLKEENVSLKLENERLMRQMGEDRGQIQSKNKEIVRLNEVIRGQGAKIQTLIAQTQQVEKLVKKLMKRAEMRSQWEGSPYRIKQSAVIYNADTPQRATTSVRLPYSHKSAKADFSGINQESCLGMSRVGSPVGEEGDEVRRFRRETLKQSRTMEEVLKMENIIGSRWR